MFKVHWVWAKGASYLTRHLLQWFCVFHTQPQSLAPRAWCIQESRLATLTTDGADRSLCMFLFKMNFETLCQLCFGILYSRSLFLWRHLERWQKFIYLFFPFKEIKRKQNNRTIQDFKTNWSETNNTIDPTNSGNWLLILFDLFYMSVSCKLRDYF